MRDRVARALEPLAPLTLRRVVTESNGTHANREAVCEACESGAVVRVYVTNSENGQKLLDSMAEAVQRAIAEAIPGATVEAAQSQENQPHCRLIRITQPDKEISDATAETKKGTSRKSRSNTGDR